jgi:uncharacterized membrane protein
MTHSRFSKYDPAVDKKFLVALSGIIWTVVGIVLCNLAVKWLSQTPAKSVLVLGLAGIILSLLIHHFGFLKIVDKNIARIMAKEGKVCIFGFQPWKSYLLIMVMIVMGMTLRNSTVPKPYLAIIYIGFGGAMLLSSLRYHRIFIKLINKS